MSAILIACAIISALSSGLKLVQAFKKEVVENPTMSGHGKGFWDFYSYSSTDTMTIKYEKGESYIKNYLIPKLQSKVTSKKAAQHSQEIIDFLEPLAEFEGYEFESAQKALTTVSGSAATMELFMWIYTFTPITSGSQKGLRIESMRMEIWGAKIAKDWTLYNVITTSFLKMKNVAEIRYSDSTAITPEKIVDAIAIAFAPVSLGLVKVPTGFLEAMKDAVQKSINNPSELPGAYTAEQLKYAAEQYDAMIKRQKERDQQAVDAVKEIGEAVATLGK